MSDTLTGHLRVWNRHWVPFCAVHDLNEWEYDEVQAANFCSQQQDEAAIKAKAAFKRVQHSRYKQCRAALGVIWSFVHGNLDLAKSWLIATTAAGLRKTAPLLARYDDTWDPTLIFGFVYGMAKAGVWIKDMPYGEARPWVCALTRLRTFSRSGDIAPNTKGRGGVYINYVPASVEKRACLSGDAIAGSVTDIRFFANKTVDGKPSEYGKFHSLGDHTMHSTDGINGDPFMASVCTRCVFESFLERRRTMRCDTDALFVSSRPTNGQQPGGQLARYDSPM